MTPKDFLQAVWPEDGFYCLATPYKVPNTDRTVFRHKVFTSIDAAAQYADDNKAKLDMFFAVHTLKKERVWNPDKIDSRTGEPGAWEIRKQSNMLGSKCFFFDLDVEADSDRKYASQAEAYQGLKEFCIAAKLPKPMITSSGGGLHVYWVLEDMIAADAWKDHAAKLRQVAKHYGLKFDPSRTTDVSSVLRVVGTFNLKKATPRPVQTLAPLVVFPTKSFLDRLDRAVIEAGVTVAATPSAGPNLFADISNLSDEYTGPPVTARAVLEACAQMRYIATEQAKVTEPEWYQALNVMRFVQNPNRFVHQMSSQHPQYSRAATDAKVAQLEAKGVKPTSCAKLADVCGEERCMGCIFRNHVKNPLMAARHKDPAPAPVVQMALGLNTVTVTIPDPPSPYTRMKDGSIAMITKNKDGDEIPMIIYGHDLHPVRRLVNDMSEAEQQVWRVVAPRSGAKDFVLDADALYDRRKFTTAISNQGIYPKSANLPMLQDYMIAYISELQRLADADAQCNHLGWTDDNTKFILPDKILLPDGTAKPASLGLGAQRSSATVQKKGTLQRQVELMGFYNHDAYLPHQFYLCGGLAAPIFLYTGHHGVIINATGEPGASKSTALYTAASFWGQPELYPINGTNNGATMRGRNERITVLANLPICVDEITNMPIRDAVDLAMSITQPGHRIRLNTDGVERNATGSYKATIMLTTANNSLHSVLSTDNTAGTAGSMRVVEIQFKRTLVHTKVQADDYIHDLMQNYGHIAEAFMSYVMTHQREVEDAVRAEMRSLDIECAIQPGERYWSSAAASKIVAARISHKLGLLPFDAEKIRRWFVTTQIAYMRGVVTEEYTSPINSLADYLEHINTNILVIQKTKGFGGTQLIPARPLHGELLARYEMDDRLMWVAIKPFKDWCVKQGLNHRKVIEELSVPRMDDNNVPQRVVLNSNTKKVLGAGVSELEKAQSRVFSVNMDHPDIRGTVDIDTTPSVKPKLTVVK